MLCTQHCLLSLFSLFINSLSILKSEVHSPHLAEQAKEPPSAGLQPRSPKPQQGNVSLQEFFPKPLLKHFTLPQSCQKLVGIQIEGMAAIVGSETWGFGDFCFIIQQLPLCRDVSSGSSTSTLPPIRGNAAVWAHFRGCYGEKKHLRHQFSMSTKLPGGSVCPGMQCRM